jgi:hypothetical protein
LQKSDCRSLNIAEDGLIVPPGIRSSAEGSSTNSGAEIVAHKTGRA